MDTNLDQLEALEGEGRDGLLEAEILSGQTRTTGVIELLRGGQRSTGLPTVGGLNLTVHSFHETEATAALICQAFSDRRLAGAAVKAHGGGFAAAERLYGNEGSPHLVIIEANETDDLLAHVEALALLCEEHTHLVLIGTHNDVALYRDLLRRGISDYLVQPMDVLALVETVLSVFADPGAVPDGKVVAFLPAKGGCGSSTLAHATALELSRRGDCHVLVLDLDLAFGAADLAFNVETGHGIRDALVDPSRIDEVFLRRHGVACGERVTLLAAPVQLEADLEAMARTIEPVLTALKKHARFIVLDLPHSWPSWMLTVARLADELVVTTTPDLAAMRNTRNLLDLLASLRPLDQTPHLVLNRVGQNRHGEVPLEDFLQTVDRKPTLVVRHDADTFGKAASYGKMPQDVNARSKTAQSLGQLGALVGHFDAGGKGHRHRSTGGSLLSGLLHRSKPA